MNGDDYNVYIPFALSLRQMGKGEAAKGLDARMMRALEQQKQALEKARGISASVHSCEQMEQVAKDNNSPRPADPGEVNLDTVNPPAKTPQQRKTACSSGFNSS